jgi:hypothetical protein
MFFFEMDAAMLLMLTLSVHSCGSTTGINHGMLAINMLGAQSMLQTRQSFGKQPYFCACVLATALPNAINTIILAARYTAVRRDTRVSIPR